MRQDNGPHESAEQHVKSIRRATRRKHSAEDNQALSWRSELPPQDRTQEIRQDFNWRKR